MSSSWPEPVDRVALALREAGVDARLEEFRAGTPTASAAAKAVGCELGQIVKTLVLVCDGAVVAALVPGDRRCDPAKVAAAVGAGEARIAVREEVVQATGFVPGAVAPFPLPGVRRVLIDRRLLGQPLVWAGAGSERHMVGMTPTQLARLARAEVVDVVDEPAYHSGPGETTEER